MKSKLLFTLGGFGSCLVMAAVLVVVPPARWLPARLARGAAANAADSPEHRRARFKESICACYPQLRDATLGDWEKVNLLRCWAYSNTCWASGASEKIDHRDYDHFYSLEVPAVFELFERRAGGVFCGGTAYALRKLYESFGFEAYEMHAGGVNERATHAVTLVWINHRGRKVLSFQDASLNHSMMDEAGEPLDLFDVVALLQQHRDNEIVIRIPENCAPPVAVLASAGAGIAPDCVRGSWLCDPAAFELQALPSGGVLIRSHRTLHRWEAVVGEQYVRFLTCFGQCPPRLLYLYLFPYYVRGADQTNATALLHELQRTCGQHIWQ